MQGQEFYGGINILSQLHGVSWQLCEHFTEDPNALASPHLFDAIMDALAVRFQESEATRLPAAYDNYFLKGHRKPREPLTEYLVFGSVSYKENMISHLKGGKMLQRKILSLVAFSKSFHAISLLFLDLESVQACR